MPAALTSADSGQRDHPVVAALTVLYSIELVGVLGAAAFIANAERTHPERGNNCAGDVVCRGWSPLSWHAAYLLHGARVLKVSGLALQSAMLMTAIAVATIRPTLGVPAVTAVVPLYALGFGRVSLGAIVILLTVRTSSSVRTAALADRHPAVSPLASRAPAPGIQLQLRRGVSDRRCAVRHPVPARKPMARRVRRRRRPTRGLCAPAPLAATRRVVV
ncbi:hypothetical protein [Mycobacterium simiae]|uniref:hypothetical protein n=1 Tax=Mycobacterium simiae TaxID=1784 RepID=UPI001CB71D27|nr:hypothetical protein [Mycobacterium simiae]